MTPAMFTLAGGVVSTVRERVALVDILPALSTWDTVIPVFEPVDVKVSGIE